MIPNGSTGSYAEHFLGWTKDLWIANDATYGNNEILKYYLPEQIKQRCESRTKSNESMIWVMRDDL